MYLTIELFLYGNQIQTKFKESRKLSISFFYFFYFANFSKKNALTIAYVTNLKIKLCQFNSTEQGKQLNLNT